MQLSEMKVGDKGEILSVQAKGEIRRRILDMGLVYGVKFKVVRVAPLGDPIEIRLKGFHLSLRKEEAAFIEVKLKGHIGDGVPMREYGPLHSPVIRKNNNNNGNRKDISVALVGNPNSGKTSIFNLLVGSNRKVGNFTGVTVDKYEGTIKYKGYSIKIIDLPGTYSLSAYSPEEVITRNFLLKEKTDVVVDVIDGSNLERNLYLTTQLMELGTDMLVALNMYDEVKKSGISIDFKQLQILLGSHVIPTSAITKTGFTSLLDHIIRVFEGKITIAKNKLTYSNEMEEMISGLEEVIKVDKDIVSGLHPRWIAIKLLENDQLIHELVSEKPIWSEVKLKLKETSLYYSEKYRSDPELIITEDRHSFIRGALKETVQDTVKEKKSITDKIDSVLLNRVIGLPIFLGIMWLIFQLTFTLGNPFVELIESFFRTAGASISELLPVGIFRSLVSDGIIAGVGGVIVFIPNIILLFLAIALLEGTGYMARAAFVIDKVMHKAGLHGKSFIPMLTGFGCSVPAIMATRTLKSKSDRIVTMLIIPFMSCGAKLPVYILLIGAFFPSNIAGNILFGIYLFGVLIAILSAKILKKAFFKGESEPFVMELPPYRMPTLKAVFFQTSFKARMYLKKAGTIILLASILIWGASNFPKDSSLENDFRINRENVLTKIELTDTQKEKAIKVLELDTRSKQLEYSLAGRIGKFIEPGIAPLGFDWRIGVALTAGFAAKEIVVSTLGTIFSLGDVDEQSEDLTKILSKDPAFSIPVALSLIVFVLLYVPCIAATTVFHKESGSWKWTRFFIFYTIAMGWVMSFFVYRISLLFFSN
ncbi:MAG: ferrous iron transport protein B [Candidatus Aminicenantes bacterium]|nr:ferrous iron transport protein B [Candidatus Aminicenantes bacterium]